MRLVEGMGGDVRVGYRLAARLGAFRVDVLDGVMPLRFRVQAAVTFADPFWTTRRPMTCTLTVGRFTLRWDGLDPTFERGAMSATSFNSPTDT